MATPRLPHMKIILQRRSYGWAAWFYGGDMPEDVELPASTHIVCKSDNGSG